jgi:hypothetical protein
VPAFSENKDLLDVYTRTIEHLKANGVDTDKSGYTLGRKLIVDAKAEKIVGDAEANALLTRDYREGFEVPAEIA